MNLMSLVPSTGSGFELEISDLVVEGTEETELVETGVYLGEGGDQTRGKLLCTNQRLYFKSGPRVLDIPFQSINEIECRSRPELQKYRNEAIITVGLGIALLVSALFMPWETVSSLAGGLGFLVAVAGAVLATIKTSEREMFRVYTVNESYTFSADETRALLPVLKQIRQTQFS